MGGGRRAQDTLSHGSRIITRSPVNWPLGIKPELLIRPGVLLCGQWTALMAGVGRARAMCFLSCRTELGTCPLADLLLKKLPSVPKLPFNCPALWWGGRHTATPMTTGHTRWLTRSLGI